MESSILNFVEGIKHDFGTLKEPAAPFVHQNWLLRPTKTQVHGTRIAIATKESQEVGEADGWYTNQKQLLLTIVNADCYPVLFARKDGGAIAALHVGWRGALNGIIYNLQNIIREHDDDMTNWVAAIGPGARPCCYQVSESLINDFSLKYSLDIKDISPKFRMLNLPTIIIYQLKAIGISAYEDSGLCTICSTRLSLGDHLYPKFYSYRRDKNKNVQVSAIMMV
ncbi:polyphenol oxidase family protein [Brenneria goodwinii]|uniref:polyphenol oxidase family protein n=1 Tax=Brenneria goodwinii TaxID=1109412 RepID=UPI000EF19D96|nr:polyphenol oxidase family protein [Brenneria goodwinii]MCG8157172.1 polyphenol oxidase family protein [Brenneria goodwinii]MCG8160088.1 polyphenol oxidase family protein [Brenneria goodwinii]MCG8164611.1 polyphenol oxidase family protein [Brenneria goodwinii]MCG8170683.1 polyphenol oxidase family protein [Brenneria goodwinii]MCG8174211.1 polyphenol oxidase family protein [Brenneria goodwinii]